MLIGIPLERHMQWELALWLGHDTNYRTCSIYRVCINFMNYTIMRRRGSSQSTQLLKTDLNIMAFLDREEKIALNRGRLG